MSSVSRRSLFGGVGALGASALARGAAGATPPTAAPTPAYRFFNAEEAAFVEPAVDRLIPPDERWPGAREAGVPTYIDQQLAGAYGQGARLYAAGPWEPGTPSQGYQLPLNPS
jgi:gluconate 2-dehydrogenase gamma chain